MQFLHIADVHLGTYFSQAKLGDFAKLRRQEIKRTFYNVLNYVDEEGIDFLLIAGDLIEEKAISIGEMKEISYRLGQLKKAQVVLIAGNHDPMTKQSVYHWTEWPENVHLMDTKVEVLKFEPWNLHIYGMSWATKSLNDPILDDIEIEEKEKINILMAHGECQTPSQYLPLNKNKLLEKGFDYIALGHIHKPEFIASNMAYAGSLEPLDFSETGPHGVIRGIINQDKKVFEFIPFASRSFKVLTLEINAEDNNEHIRKKIEERLEVENVEDLFRIQLQGHRAIDFIIEKEEIEADFRAKGWSIQLLDKSKPSYDLEQLIKENKENLIGRYIAELLEVSKGDELTKEALYLGLEALLAEKVKAC